MADGGARAFRLERQDQCWPLLYHLEPLLASYQMGALAVTVLDERGSHEYRDVASAQAGSREHPPHRVEMYLIGAGCRLAGLWLVGLGPGQEPAVTVPELGGMSGQAGEIRASVAEFLGEEEPVPAGAAAAPGGAGWRWIVNQPWTVQVVGGVIATLVASAIVAVVTTVLR
jgi:hypothetical protein